MFFTVNDVATELKISTKTVRRWIDRGDLTVKKFGTLIRIPQEEMERLQIEGNPCKKACNVVSSISHLKSPVRRQKKDSRLWV